MTKTQNELLIEELKLIEKASEILAYSYEKCKEIDKKDEYSLEEQDKLENLTSRFARLSDILFQKIYRLFDEIELERPGTVRDRINRAAKRELLSDIEIASLIRILRNQIAHDYLPDEIFEIYNKVTELTPELLNMSSKAIEYAKNIFK